MPQRIIFPERGRAALQHFELPAMAEDSVRVRTIHSLMSIGTETAILNQKYDPGTHYDRIFAFPQLKTGVQAVARVESVGPAVRDFAEGDRVYMRMAHGSHQVLPESLLSPIPEAVDSRTACWCGLAKTAFRAAKAAPFALGGRVLIIGAGPVGQMAIRWARSANVGLLVVSDLSAQRLQHAQRGGATHTLCGDIANQIEAIRKIAQGQDANAGENLAGNGNLAGSGEAVRNSDAESAKDRARPNSGVGRDSEVGPDIVVEATGNPAIFASALTAAARFGKVVLLGDTGYPDRQHLTSDVMTKGLSIQATHDSHDRHGWTQRKVDALFFASVLAGRFDVDGLITHEFSPDQCVEAYALATNSREQALGVLFDWSQTDW